MQLKGYWLWTEEKTAEFNSYVRFRKTFDYDYGKAVLNITGDTRYALYVNGEYVGAGPARSWPNHYKYDTYDIEPYLNRVKNVICVILMYMNTSNFQVIHCEPGLYCELNLENKTIYSDRTFKSQPDRAFESNALRQSVQLYFEEIYNANYDDGWLSADYNDDNWKNAYEIRPAKDGLHNNMTENRQPHYTMEPVSPKRVVEANTVTSADYLLYFSPKNLIHPGNKDSFYNFHNVFAGTYIYSDRDAVCKVRFEDIEPIMDFYFNGKKTEKKFVKLVQGNVPELTLELKKGYNDFVIRLYPVHDMTYTFAFFTDAKITFNAYKKEFKESDAKLALIGPFAFDEDTEIWFENFCDNYEDKLRCDPKDPTVGLSVFEDFLSDPRLDRVCDKPYYTPFPEYLCPKASPYFQTYNDLPRETLNPLDYNYLCGNNTWTKITPNENGDVRILLDYGKEIIGYETFEINSPKDVIIDFMFFEFIQPDGVRNYTEGLRNAFRYITKEGRQTYKSLYRRGYQYAYITFRNLKEPLYIRNVTAYYSTAQPTNQGSFVCSDYKLNKIWETCRRTARLCSEDVYTDCPTYEQTAWMADSNNSSLVDLVANGSMSILKDELILGGQTLERSPIIESMAPSGWRNFLVGTSWTHILFATKYYFYTGDKDGFLEIYEYIEKNLKGIIKSINSNNLFERRAWYFLDWAGMDTPNEAIVTHANCFLVYSLTELGKTLNYIGMTDKAEEYISLGNRIKEAINRFMWNEEKQAYTDCIKKGVQSEVFSQQTQVMAYMAGVPTEDRKERVMDLILNPPDDFVKAGSSAFEGRRLWIFADSEMTDELLELIRRSWGYILDKGATTIWEQWTLNKNDGERLTRSHCHGYSSLPAFFLSEYILGIRPKEPGYKSVVIKPHFGDLDWARGSVMTKYGLIRVEWKKDENGEYTINVDSPVPYEIIKNKQKN